MMNQNLTFLDLQLDIFGMNSPYFVSRNSKFKNQTLTIDLTSTPTLLGGIDEIIILQLDNVLSFKSEHDIPINSPKVFRFNVGAFSSSQSVQSGGSGASYTFVFTLMISLGVSLFTGGSIELMWSLANSLQIIFYFGYIRLYYTPELLIVFSYMKFSNFDNPIFEYIRNKTYSLLTKFKISSLSSDQLFGLSSSSIVINFMDKILIILWTIFLIIWILLLKYFWRNKSNKVANFIRKKEIELRYEGLSRFYFEIVLNLSFLAFYNMTYGSLNNLFDVVSYICAGLFLIFVFYTIIYSFAYPTYYYEDIWVYPDFHERHCLLFLEFNKDKLK